MTITVTPEIKELIEAAADAAARRAVFEIGAAKPRESSAGSTLIRLEAVMAETGLSRSSIYRLINEAELPTVKQGRSLCFRRADLDAYLARIGGAA